MKLLQAKDICRGILHNLNGQRCAMGWILARTLGYSYMFPMPGTPRRERAIEATKLLMEQEQIPAAVIPPWAESENDELNVPWQSVAKWNNDPATPAGKIAAALNQLFATLDGTVREAPQDAPQLELVTA